MLYYNINIIREGVVLNEISVESLDLGFRSLWSYILGLWVDFTNSRITILGFHGSFVLWCNCSRNICHFLSSLGKVEWKKLKVLLLWNPSSSIKFENCELKVKAILGTRTLIAVIVSWLIGIYSIYVGFINSIWIEFFVGIGFLVAGIYLMRKFVKDRKKGR